MKRWFGREVLRFVDAWACREGTPEDDEDARARVDEGSAEGEGCGCAPTSSADEGFARRSMSNGFTGNDESYFGHEASAQEWLEFDVHMGMRMDEELGRDIGQRD